MILYHGSKEIAEELLPSFAPRSGAAANTHMKDSPLIYSFYCKTAASFCSAFFIICNRTEQIEKLCVHD